jgi:hypothetical protein
VRASLGRRCEAHRFGEMSGKYSAVCTWGQRFFYHDGLTDKNSIGDSMEVLVFSVAQMTLMLKSVICLVL